MTCSGGGYVQVYGRVGDHTDGNVTMEKSLDASHPMPELEQFFVTSVSAGTDFVVALTDAGQAFVFDDCAELIRLPTASNVAVRHITAYDRLVLGMTSDGHMYEWTEPALSCSQSHLISKLVRQSAVPCSLMTWSGKAFSINSYYSCGACPIPCLKNAIGIMFKTADLGANCPFVGKFLTEINPYKRANYTKRLIESAQISLDDSFENSRIELILEQDDDRSFAKAVQIRLEQEQTDSLLQSLLPMTYSRLSLGLAKIREYSEAKRLHDSTVARSRLPNTLIRVVSHATSQQILRAFSSLKQLNHLMAINSLNLEQENILLARTMQEGAKTITRVLHSAFSELQLLKSAFSQLKIKARSEQRMHFAISQLAVRVERDKTARLKRAIKHWNDFIIRMHIRGHGVIRLQHVFDTTVGRTVMRQIKRFADLKLKAREALRQVLHNDRAAIRRRLAAFMTWRTYTLELRIDRRKRSKVYLLIAKVVKTRLMAAVNRVDMDAWRALKDFNPKYTRESIDRLLGAVKKPLFDRQNLLLTSLRAIKRQSDRGMYLGDSTPDIAQVSRAKRDYKGLSSSQQLSGTAFDFDDIAVKSSVPRFQKPPLSSKNPALSHGKFDKIKTVPKLKLGGLDFERASSRATSNEAEETNTRSYKRKHSGSLVIHSVAVSPRSKNQQGLLKFHPFSKPSTPSSRASEQGSNLKHNRCLTPHCCLNQLAKARRGLDLAQDSFTSNSRTFKAIDSRLITQHLMTSQDSDNYLRKTIGLERLIKAWEAVYKDRMMECWVKLKYCSRLCIPPSHFFKSSKAGVLERALEQVYLQCLGDAWMSLYS